MDRAHHDPSRSPSAASQDGAGGAPRTNGRIGERTGRTLLRKLRDLDLRVRGLSVDAARRVRLEGCLSPDAPIEDGLTYRLRLQDGSTAHLDLAWREGALELGLAGAGTAAPQRVELIRDDHGRATAPSIRARIHPEDCDRREAEHFLRRLVRAAFARQDVA